MTDITNFRNDELTALFMLEFREMSAALHDPETGDLIAQPIYKTCIGLDTESTTISHQTDVKVKGKYRKMTVVDHCFCYTYQVSVGTQNYAIYRTVEELLNFLDILIDTLEYLQIGNETRAKCLIWVANLSHEFSFIKYKLFERLQCKKMFAKSPRDVLYLNFDLIEFRECLGLFGRSLADIAKNWCQTQKCKGDLDYDLVRISTATYCTPITDQEKQYCINDVIILSEMHEKVYETYMQDNGALIIPYTRSGFVRMKLKNSLRNDPKITEKREKYNERQDLEKYKKANNIDYIKMCNAHLFVDAAQWSLCREYGYSGGLCGSNIEKVGITLKNVICADLTSDYPALMLHNKYPDGWLREKPLRDFNRYLKYRNTPFLTLAIVDFKSKSLHATFSEHKIINLKEPLFKKHYGEVRELIPYNGKVLQAYNCIVIMNDVDIAAYELIYDMKITPLKLWAFDRYRKLPAWITEPIKEDYTIKAGLKHTEAEKTQAYKDAKINVNTYYGVTATRSVDALDAFNEKKGCFKASRHKSYKQMQYDTWLNPYIAFWTTSYARSILMYFISKYPEHIIQYDTDSLYYDKCDALTEELKAYNEKITAINEKLFKDDPMKEKLIDLGCWDFEKEYDQFLGMGAKKYIKQIGDTVYPVIAGLPKGAIPEEIKAKNIKEPLEHYNVTNFVKDFATKPEIVIKHMFAHKFASVYSDSPYEYTIDITDHLGVTGQQKCSCYHAIVPIDFTLSMALDYIKQVFKVQKRTL